MTAPARTPAPPTVADLLAEQDGVISRVQARRAGKTEDWWQWQLDSGRLTGVLPGVAVAHSGELTDRQKAWVAVVRAGDDACLTADAGLIVHGMKLRSPSVLHVVTARDLRAQTLQLPEGAPDVRVRPHRTDGFAQWRHPVKLPPVLRVAPAALHAAAWATTARAGEWRLAAAVQQGLIPVGDLRTALGQMPRLPRRALIAAVLDDVEYGAHAASELDLLRFLRRHGLPLPDRLQRPIRTGRQRYLDAWWEKQRVGAEMDGAHHRLVGSWEDDALRGNDVVLVERHDRILLLRFTRGNLRHDELRVAEQLRAALL